MATRHEFVYALVSASFVVALAGSGKTDAVLAPAPATPMAVETQHLGLVSPLSTTSSPPRPDPIDADPEQLLRIYDFSPASEANPVVAWIADTPIAVPVSEFRAYLKAEVSEEDRNNLDTQGKRRRLERLVDELVLLHGAYQKNVDKGERLVRTLESTRRMLLVEFLRREEVGDKAKSAEQYAVLQAELEDRLFEKAEIIVSNEGYAALQEAVARHGSGKLEELAPDLGARPLAQCGDMKVTLGDVFSTYVALPPEKRPDITAPSALSGLLKKLLTDGLAVAEARKRGIDKSRSYRETVAANRAALTRMWVQDRITDKAVQQMRVEKATSVDALRERVRAERAESLREGRKVQIDERLLAGV
ncbi:MAG TPA: hypothetical protein VNO21_05810 [Polyangiaceae bacterium]|nr:hypothetical protein [Polyangiaceae bacterium]